MDKSVKTEIIISNKKGQFAKGYWFEKGLTGKTLSEEHKKKISHSVRGEKNGFYGKRHSEETRIKMKSIVRKKKKSVTAETKRRISEAHRGSKSHAWKVEKKY